MAINPYSRPAESNYFNTYIPIPFEEMALAIGQKKQDYELAAAKTDQLQDYLIDFKTGPGKDEEDYRNMMLDVDTKLADLQERYPDLGTIEYKTELNKIIKGVTRDDFFRQAPVNRERYIEGLQKLAEAQEDNNEWNYYTLKDALDNYLEIGTKGLMESGISSSGMLQLPGVTKKVNMQEAVAKIGRDFQRRGYNMTRNDETGRYITKEGRVGVPAEEVAKVFGFAQYKKDEEGKEGDWYLHNFNEALMDEIGPNLRNKAKWLAEQYGTTPEEELVNLYVGLTKPAVDIYGGEVETDSITLTSKGLDELGSGVGGFVFSGFTQDAKKLTKDYNFNPDKDSRMWKFAKVVNQILAPLRGTTASGVLLSQSGVPTAEKILERIDNNEMSLEEGLKEIENRKEEVINALNDKKAFLQSRITNYYFTMLSDLIKSGYYAKASKVLTDERERAVYEKLRSTNTLGPVSDKPYEELTEKEKKVTHDSMNKEYKRSAKEGIHIPIMTPANVKLKQQAQDALFGTASSGGKVYAKQINGVALNYKIFDINNPDKQYTLGEYINDNATDETVIDWNGVVDAVNNPYSGGLHDIKIGGLRIKIGGLKGKDKGKEFLMQVTRISDAAGNDLPEGHFLRNRDWVSEFIPNLLGQYQFDAAGIGDWFEQGGKQIRTVGTDWEYVADDWGIRTYVARTPQLQIKHEDGRIEKINFEPFDKEGNTKDRTIVDTYTRWIRSLPKSK